MSVDGGYPRQRTRYLVRCPFHVTVVQDTLHVKTLTTVRIHLWLWWGGISTPSLSELPAEVGRLQQRVHDLCNHSDQERQERLSLEAWVERIRLYRSEFAFYLLENDRARQGFHDEVADLRRQNAALQSQIEKLARDYKSLVESLERGGCIRPRK